MPLKIMLLLVLLSTCTALLKKKNLNVYDTKIFILFFFLVCYMCVFRNRFKTLFSLKIRLFKLKLACFEREKKF